MNLAPYFKKLSVMLRRLSTTNMIAIRFKKPRYFWVGDSPESMEICLTLLGENERQLLYFLEGQSVEISLMHCSVDVMVAMTTSCFSW